MRANHTATCAHCGKTVTLSKGQRFRIRQGGPIYCDRQCYQASRITETKQACAVCGTPFLARADNLAKGYARYCSKACSNSARAIPEVDRFWALVDQAGDGCWPWTAARDKNGYGVFGRDGRKQAFAHRVAYELHYGVAPGTLLTCHHCDNPPCCRPDHLFLGTNADNMADMARKKRGRH